MESRVVGEVVGARADWTYAFKYFGTELDNGGGRSGRSDGRSVTSIWIDG